MAGTPPKAVWTRAFKTGTKVFLNTTDHPKVDTACIWWSDGTTSGNHCAQLGGVAGTPAGWWAPER